MVATSRALSLTPVGTGRLSGLVRRVGTPLALVLLVGLALLLRLRGLEAEGMLDLDEARLTLAAQGIAAHGWPVFPSGKVYTRGLLQSFLMAPSVALLEPIELAARLPSVVAGAALVLVVYLYGRQLAGQRRGPVRGGAGGHVGPADRAVARGLVLRDLHAVLDGGAAAARPRGGHRSFRALLAGATVVGLTFLAHEFAITLLPGFGAGAAVVARGMPAPPCAASGRW